jgi:hypothetical protein
MIIPLFPPLQREGVKKSVLSAGQEYLQSLTNAVIWKVRVTRLCS